MSEFDDRLEELKAEAKEAAEHVAAWEESKSVDPSSRLAEVLAQPVTAFLAKRSAERETDAKRLADQIERGNIAEENRKLAAKIEANQIRLKQLGTSAPNQGNTRNGKPAFLMLPADQTFGHRRIDAIDPKQK